ncbi:MAG: transaldolase family protein [Prochlorococcaceae cyanobacterium]
MALRLFLDSAHPADWQQWLPSGLFHGITTNPTLLRRAGLTCGCATLESLCHQAVELGCRELHLQAWGADSVTLEQRGRGLAGLAPEVVVKVPISCAGAAAAQALIRDGLPLTLTACYGVPQVLVAAVLGARYVAPYLGRISDSGLDGEAEVRAMQASLRGLGSTTRLLVASLRDTASLGRLTAAGLDTFTISASMAAALLTNSQTEHAARAFERDALDAGGDGPR